MNDRDYVLGTHDDEIERLARQHYVWRPAMLGAWRKAGFRIGQRLLDVGCGPGHASCDLGDVVGRSGGVVGVERSHRFLEAARHRAETRGLGWLEFRDCDLDQDPIPGGDYDGAWCRWVFSFLTEPEALPAKLHEALRPGARLVLHEYFDYAAWCLLPPAEPFERFVAAVMESWRDAGGEPDIARRLPHWLQASGFAITAARPLVEVTRPNEPVWSWPAEFARVAIPRLVASGHLTEAEANRAIGALDDHESDPAVMMVTPAVLELVAVRQ